MTGTGTENDPFLVDNWTDFMTIDTNSAEIFVRWADNENKTIDFNEINPEGFSETVNFPANVDFNGWTLKNFHSTVSGNAIYSSGGSIENLIFENFYITAQKIFYGSFLLKNCIISGIAQNTGNVYILHGGGLKNCSMNVMINASNRFDLSTGDGFISPQSQITNSDVILDISCAGEAILCTGATKNSRISGKIQTTAKSVSLGSSSSISNIFNLESNKPLKYSSSAISIFNSEIAEKSSDSNAIFTGVTSEQLKNAEYLYNLGFPIGVD